MPKRITITHTCSHAGERLPAVVEKFWDSSPDCGRVCWCLTDPEKNKPMPTKMRFTVEVLDSKPE